MSRDLRSWTVLPNALEGGWWMYYTGICHGDDGLRQRIGRAYGTDLTTGAKDERFLLEADPAYFEQLDVSVWPDLCWRDPCVFADPDNGGYAMLVTARVPDGPADGRGVVAPQVVPLAGRHYLAFCAYGFANSAARMARTGRATGIHCSTTRTVVSSAR